MKYDNNHIDGEHVFRREFKYKEKPVFVTCVFRSVELSIDGKDVEKQFFGFSVKSPKDDLFNKRALEIARGRLNKAVFLGQKYVFPSQRWIKRDQFVSMANEALEELKKVKKSK